LGYTAFVLKYRVPKKQHGALQDIQRAIRVVRSRSDEWNIDPNKLGVLGFSAGGSLCARASTRYGDITYEPVDDADQASARPDFAVLIYPAYLDHGHNRTLTPELSVDRNTPPMFLFATYDDRYGNGTLVMGKALSDHNVPVEVHYLPRGGHGYGLRPGKRAAETWPGLAEAWMRELLD
jgi:acetyl esterase/lipase